ncbi:hypothetical protein [Iningainema tapete]|uniref:Uncharacterized protein n=2 Tax=Iningainema TaxID=1932705 RepID=A0A8J7C9Q5_9CYAN|nr:hypothetical protein [Iningainema tapete BLCC-T55]
MSKTSDALATQDQLIIELARVITEVVRLKNASETEKDAALAQVSDLLKVDELDAATAQQANDKLREMINVLAAAIPTETPAPEPAPIEEPVPVEEPA